MLTSSFEMAGVCERTVRDWYAFCRATCSKEHISKFVCSLDFISSFRQGVTVTQNYSNTLYFERKLTGRTCSLN
ncbi:hypothetical protein PHMEG_00026122 [Phytophthora megakarya]|uniref:Uncharacterized protein n=1 Tax=Phytophthora megakarya TaxID=4795 RepID=A0A225VCW5_9STRA|nr:hypothetical protein PHMEG_00026122 [Phytophthora megakarya]